jgi:paraquat-inducible protein B
VTGLSEGSDVTMHGLKIGEVTDVGLYYDKVKDQILAPVSFRIEPSRIAGAGAAEELPEGMIATRLVQRGLRATLQSTSLVLGDKAVVLDFFPDAPPAELRKEGDAFIMPTTEAGGFENLQHSATELLGKINQIDFAKIGASVTGLTTGLDSLVNAPQLKQTLVSLQATMSEAESVTRNLNTGSAPALHRLPQLSAELQDTLAKANLLVASLTAGYGNDTRFQHELERLLPELTDAVRSIRTLSDLLSRHPEALVRGRSDQGGK